MPDTARHTDSALLTYSVVVEPDRQRLARFVIDAVDALGGNEFAAAGQLAALLGELRRDSQDAAEPIEVRLELAGGEVALAWNQRRSRVVTLAASPASEDVEALARRLKTESERADPSLLKRRNEEIQHDLEAARERAQAEMAELETVLASKQAELKEQIRNAQTDALTGLFNRAAYDERLYEAVRRSGRQREPLSLMFLDMDNFKEINDTYGHQEGDERLKNMAEAMRGAVRRDVDLCFRIGGDEFAIVVFAGHAIARRGAETILQRMERRVSIGIAELVEGDDFESFAARADRALYSAKEHGRGCIAEDGDLPLAAGEGR